MATTAAGTPYVVSSDTASDYPTTSLALANRVDAVEDKILYSGLRLPGTTGNYVSAPDAAGLDITGDIDIRCHVALADWTPASAQCFLSKESGSTGGREWKFYIDTSGRLEFQWSTTGASGGFVAQTSSANLSALAANAVKWVRVTLDVDNGSAGYDVKFWTSDDGSSWTQLGVTRTGVGTTSIYAGNGNIEVGSYATGTQYLAAGKFYRAQVYNGIAGTLAANADFRMPWASRHSDSVGNTWTLNGSAWAWTVEAIA